MQAVTARLEAERHGRLTSEVDPKAAEVARLRSTLSLAELQHAGAGASTHAHLARAPWTKRSPPLPLPAASIPGPSWSPVSALDPPMAIDGRCGTAARCPPPATGRRIASASSILMPRGRLGTRSPSRRPRRRDYDRVGASIVTAEQAYATGLASADLAAEHRDLTNTLALDPPSGESTPPRAPPRWPPSACPAPYLCAALGPCPDPGPDRDAWIEGADAVETYRHREPGLAPGDGAFASDDPLGGAIGPEPDDFATARLWETAARHIAREELALEVAQPDFGVDL